MMDTLTVKLSGIEVLNKLIALRADGIDITELIHQAILGFEKPSAEDAA